MLLLLLAVCGNTANLMLARASARQREVGMRVAFGAGPWRIVTLLPTENLLLALLGAALGAAIAAWATEALRAVPVIGAFPIKFQTSLNAVGLGFATLLGIICGLLFGAAPALQLARVDPQAALRAGSRTAGRSGMRNALMGVAGAESLLAPEVERIVRELVVIIAGTVPRRSPRDRPDPPPRTPASRRTVSSSA